MKKIILLFLVFHVWNQNAQGYSVTYSMEQVAKEINLTTTLFSFLDGNGNHSLYEEDFANSRMGNPADSNINIINLDGDNSVYYKDLKANTVVYKDHIRFKFFTIRDLFSGFNWELHNETKDILGYTCQKATCRFRGRDYTVYYTTSIPVSDGPWKFSGLPGLILELSTDDRVASLHVKATKIVLGKPKAEYKNPYEGQGYISFDRYRELYREKYEESLHRITGETGKASPLPKGFLEYYIE
ncbi:hypothetical protein CHU92_05815 [Flavobacterium cyanobacteriorum]|uniref:GLPGLI family protein n=1 Tax=Flavobacterium cyanobacteriorum TaxID=2022802 RepID=A0A255Z9N1_9FLAO|nr:GLPGLI family protein [Flavobacterium cyanobacteriorum]OYQ38267.1 hypothetical protein CHU92_05815 [Flavobacterium cyanobacteriorum]